MIILLTYTPCTSLIVQKFKNTGLIMKNTPFIAVTSQPVPYHADTTAIFNTLCQQNSNSLLLDSAEIGSKNSLQSLILINAAVKITCLGNQVTFIALNSNGKQVLK